VSDDRQQLADAGLVVVKVGSTLVVDEASGEIRRDWLMALADDIAALRARGQKVVIVSSGAIAAGRRRLGLKSRKLKLEQNQASAAVGMIRIAHAFQDALARHDIPVAQSLLTLEDSEIRRRYLNARSTFTTLLELGAVPLINENDTVATDEIRFGDNDRLSARVAAMISADTLVLLSDIDGLYTADPRVDPKAEFVPVVRDITGEIEASAGATRTDYGTGGMKTKIAAARIALGAGCRMVIAQGRDDHALRKLDESGRGTWFLPTEGMKAARKQWILGGLHTAGTVTIDAGALKALKAGRSLLPAGVTAVNGGFDRGDAIAVEDLAGNVVARGLSAYSSDDARLLLGRKSSDIEDILGYRGRDELIHRDDLVMT
jgi:glutamate 5-kinase